MWIVPRDLALLIDRFQVLFGRPSTISEGRSLSVTITSIVELRGLGTSGPNVSSGLPRVSGKRPD